MLNSWEMEDLLQASGGEVQDLNLHAALVMDGKEDSGTIPLLRTRHSIPFGALGLWDFIQTEAGAALLLLHGYLAPDLLLSLKKNLEEQKSCG